MSKDRFVAFFDAIMAIIMTIVVLEFVERYVDNMLYFTIDGGFAPPPDPAEQ